MIKRSATVIACWRALALLAACLSLPVAAQADVTTRDLQIVARTLGFLDPPFSGEVRMGILYDPASTRSGQQADALELLLGTGLRAGNLRLVPVSVSLAQATTSNVDFFFLSEGTDAAAIPALLAARGLLCLTIDLAQVRAGNCTVGVQSAPKVEILVNRHLASAAQIRFATVFRMMIVEL